MHKNVDKTGWVALVITKKGDVLDKATNRVIATAQQTDKGPLANVGGKVTATWKNEDGQTCVYSQMERSGMDAFVGGFSQSAVDGMACSLVGPAGVFFAPEVEEEDRIMGEATCGNKAWVVGGEKGTKMTFIDKISGNTVLHYRMDQPKDFYSKVVSETELEEANEADGKEGNTAETAADKALCAQEDTEYKGDGISILVKPDFMKEIPAALFAVCYLFGELSESMATSMASTAGYILNPF